MFLEIKYLGNTPSIYAQSQLYSDPQILQIQKYDYFQNWGFGGGWTSTISNPPKNLQVQSVQ